MSEIAADPPAPSCFHLHSGSGIEESQQLGPDRFSPRADVRARTRARDERGRFAKGHSGNPRGRPPGIPNPRRHTVSISAFRKNPEAAFALFDRRPDLLRQLTEPLLPPRARAIDPAERIGLDLSAIHAWGDVADAISMALAAASRGELAPAEALCLARRVRSRLRLAGRLQLIERRLPRTAAREDDRSPRR